VNSLLVVVSVRKEFLKSVLLTLLFSSSNIIKEIAPCILQMELFSAAGKPTDGGEGKLSEFPCGEEGVVLEKSELKGIPLFFISEDLALAEAIIIISCT
jgi:hypothetical protein